MNIPENIEEIAKEFPGISEQRKRVLIEHWAETPSARIKNVYLVAEYLGGEEAAFAKRVLGDQSPKSAPMDKAVDMQFSKVKNQLRTK